MFTFADSFDFYTTVNDPMAGYWDSGATTGTSFASGRFAGSQALQFTAGLASYTKSSAVNDAVHHIVMAFRQTAALTGSTLGIYFQLSDAATNQCCIVFRSDGTILLTSATPAGTVLATYSGAVTAANIWVAFEFEVVISATVGRFRVRKNGNTSDDFDSGATLNTRPGTNAYANKLTLGMSTTVNASLVDDVLWRSDPTSVAWMGDIRSYTRMPASDASVQFARSLSTFGQQQTAALSTFVGKSANNGCMSAFTATYSGTIASGTVGLNSGGTGNMKAAIYDSTRTIVLATSNAVVNPGAGNIPITFGTPLTVTKGTTYHLAVDQDFTINYNVTAASQWSFTTTYASFPVASPVTTSAQPGPTFTLTITPTVSADFVNETLQDGTTSYVYDATVGHGDLYNIAAASPPPTSVVAVTTRGFIEKSDAGARSGAVQLKSGVTTAQSTSTPLASNFTWLYRTDSTDPNTGSAWTPAAVDALQIGQVVTA